MAASQVAAISFFSDFFLFGRIILSTLGKNKKHPKRKKKVSMWHLFLVTGPLHRKQNFFLVWPNL